MILIPTGNFKTFDEYVASLSQKGRKEIRRVLKANEDLDYMRVKYDRDLVEHWMNIWRSQLVRGKPIKWDLSMDTIDEYEAKGMLRVFWVVDSSGATVGMNFNVVCDGYVDHRPPMYNKDEFISRSLGKYMQIKLFEYAIEEEKFDYVDVGGVGLNKNDSWPTMIRNRNQLPFTKHKWMYVPEDVKRNPEQQPEFQVEEIDGIKHLIKP